MSRRKMQDFILKSKSVFIGLEDSKTTWVICVRADKEIKHETSMPAKYEVLRSYLRRFPDCDITVVYEAGFKGFGLFDNLVEDGYKCIVIPPHRVAQEKCSRVKNDKTDAKLLAKNLENGDCESCHVPDRERRSDRQVVRTLNAVDKDIRVERNRVRKFLQFHGIDSGIQTDDWRPVHFRSLRNLSLDSMLKMSLDIMLDKLELYWKYQKELRKTLSEITKKERYASAFKIAKSFPGIGELTAIRLVLEFGEDFSRFKSGAAIANFVGLGCCEHSSGESVNRGGITKQGNSLIRSWLIQNAWVAIRKDPALQEFYSRIRQNSGKANKAIVAVARKLIVRLRSCMIRNEEYCIGVIQ